MLLDLFLSLWFPDLFFSWFLFSYYVILWLFVLQEELEVVCPLFYSYCTVVTSHFPPTHFLCLHPSFNMPATSSQGTVGYSSSGLYDRPLTTTLTWVHSLYTVLLVLLKTKLFLELKSILRMVNFGLTRAPHLPCCLTHSHTRWSQSQINGLGISLSLFYCFVGNPHADFQCQQSVAQGHCFPQSHKSHRHPSYPLIHCCWSPTTTKSLSKFSTCTQNSCLTAGHTCRGALLSLMAD